MRSSLVPVRLVALTALALLVAACEVNVQHQRGARNPPPNGNGGSTAPPAYGSGGTTTTGNGGTTTTGNGGTTTTGNGGSTAPPAYGSGGTTTTGNGGTTAPPAYGNGGTTTPPPATAATPTTPPPAYGGGNRVRVPAYGTGIPYGSGATGAWRATPIQVVLAPPAAGQGSRRGDMEAPFGRIPLVSGDVDFGTNIQYADSFKGVVYLLPPGTTSMPTFDGMRPQLAMYTRTFEVEPQNFAGLGAPGASLRSSNFGIRYDGVFTTRVAGSYQFSIANEDGARLYIDGRLVLDNDGVHVVTFKVTDVDLTAGSHTLRVDYFKAATSPEVALEVWVHSPTMPTNAVTMLNPSL
ncbi:hypothetical protein BH09MYX1_BH09MYX1_41840 [soil metagenome]